jgi:hypothetical protein
LLTGGTATTNFPQYLAQHTGATAVTSWSTAGTYFGVNADSGFSGNFIDFHTNGGNTIFSVASTGAITVGAISINSASSSIAWTARSRLQTPADGVFTLTNNGVTGFSRLNFGGTTSSFVALQSSGTTLTIGTCDGGTSTGNLQVCGNLILAAQTPATSSSAGTAGTFAYDSNYLYICIATNTWRRVAHATW